MRTASELAMPPPKQKPGDAELAGAVGTGLQPHGRGVEVLGHLRAIDLAEQLAALLVVAGIAADRREAVRRERHEVLEREPPRDVLDVRVEAAVLVDDEDARQLVRGRRWPDAPGSP